MILQRIGSCSKENIDQTIISDFGQKSLLVTECISPNDFRSRIWNLYGQKVWIWQYSIERNELEDVFRVTCALYDPFVPLRLRVNHILWQCLSITIGIHDIAEILR